MSERIKGELLIVGGDENLRAIHPSLRSAGIDVRTAENVYDALLSFEKRRTDWILLDLLGMEEEDLELISAIRRIAPECPVILSFSHSRRELAAQGLERGAFGYVLRPFYVGELLALLGRSIEERPAPPSFDALEQLAGGVSHEINNPLTIVAGWVQMMLQDTDENSRHRRPLEVIKKECERIAAVVQDLQLIAARHPLEKHPVRMTQLILDTIEDMREAGELKHLRADLRPTGSLPHVELDAVQMKRAFREFIRNAVDATAPPGGHLVIEITPKGDHQLIRLVDNGRGIQPENLARVFLPFFTEGSREGRRGIGLSLARGIVEAHGGSLEITSGIGVGTTVEITLALIAGVGAVDRKRLGEARHEEKPE